MTRSTETATVLVRMALPSDAPSLAAIHARCFPRAWDEAAMAQFLAFPAVSRSSPRRVRMRRPKASSSPGPPLTRPKC